MTDDERARAIVDVLRGTINNLKQGYSFTSSVLDTLELTEQFMQQEIEKALHDERRRVWEGIEELDKRCVSNTEFRISIKHALMVIRYQQDKEIRHQAEAPHG